MSFFIKSGFIDSLKGGSIFRLKAVGSSELCTYLLHILLSFPDQQHMHKRMGHTHISADCNMNTRSSQLGTISFPLIPERVTVCRGNKGLAQTCQISTDRTMPEIGAHYVTVLMQS
jgi:hypothetical protein